MKTSKEYRAAWEAYAEIWKLEGAEAKRAACEARLSKSCTYTDPLTRRQGWDDLVEYMVEFHQQVPGGHFVTKDYLFHHGCSIAHWDMVAGDGSVLGEGTSYGEYDGDGKLTRMTGFFETPEPTS